MYQRNAAVEIQINSLCRLRAPEQLRSTGRELFVYEVTIKFLLSHSVLKLLLYL